MYLSETPFWTMNSYFVASYAIGWLLWSLFIRKKTAVKTTKPVAMSVGSLPGEWFPWYSTKPLHEAEELRANYSAYVCRMVAERGKIARIHPGLRVILIADHSVSSTVLGSDAFDREPLRRFTSAVARFSIVGNSYPALATNEDIGHGQARRWTLAIMKQRLSGLQDAIDNVLGNLPDCQDQELLPFVLHVNASIIFRWIFGTAPDMADVYWYLRNIFSELCVDTFASRTVMHKPKFCKDDQIVLNRLLRLVTESPYWNGYCELAKKIGIRETKGAEQVDDAVIARNLLFTFMLGSYGAGLAMHPSIAMLSKAPSLVADLRNELSKTGGIAPLCSSPSEHPLLQAVSLELLRLFPAPTHFCRVAKEDVVVTSSDGTLLTFHKGTKVMVSAAHMHTDETVFGSNAKTFDPSRFLYNPELAEKLLIFGIPHRSKSGSARMCQGSGPVGALPRVTPHGCAAAEAGFGLPLFKTVLSRLIMKYNWKLDQMPIFDDPRYFGFVGPINLRLASFSSRPSGDSFYDFIPSSSSVLDKIRSANPHERFEAACNLVIANVSSIRPDTGTKLYGLYKQASLGDAPKKGPGFTMMTARNKWAVWKMFQGLSKEEAKEQYVDLVRVEIALAEKRKPSRSIASSKRLPISEFDEKETKNNDNEVDQQHSIAVSLSDSDVAVDHSGAAVLLTVAVNCEPILASHDDTEHCPHCEKDFKMFYESCRQDQVQLQLTFTGALQSKATVSLAAGLGRAFLNGGVASGEVLVPVAWTGCKETAATSVLGKIIFGDNGPLRLPGMSLFLISIQITTPELVSSRFFPIQSWVRTDGVFCSFDDEVSVRDLCGPFREGAELELGRELSLWRWGSNNGLPSSTFKAICEIPDTYEQVLNTKLIPDLGLPEDAGTTATSISDFVQLIVDSTQPLPAHVAPTSKQWDWANDLFFSELALGGSHPHHLRLLTKSCVKACTLLCHVPSHALDVDDNVPDALGEGRFFFLSYDILKGLPVNDGNWLPAPTCIFYWSRAKGHLVPVVIEIDHAESSLAFFAGEVAVVPDGVDDDDVDQVTDPSFWKWMIAKAAVRCADTNYCQVVPHYLFSHLAPELVAIAAHRMFPASHPLMRILKPHFASTVRINVYARNIILPWLIPAFMSVHGAEEDLLKRAWRDNELHDRLLNFPRDLRERGMEGCVIPDYPYRDDGKALFQAIKKYALSSIRHIYPTEASIGDDLYLQRFQDDLTSVGYFGYAQDGQSPIPPLEPLGSSYESLSNFLACAIFNASVTHATMNYNMYEIYAFAPLTPMHLRPVDNGSPRELFSRAGYFQVLPSLEKASGGILLEPLTQHNDHDTALGAHEGLEGEMAGLCQRLQLKKDLSMISKMLEERNTKRAIKYDLLFPQNVTNSVVQ